MLPSTAQNTCGASAETLAAYSRAAQCGTAARQWPMSSPHRPPLQATVLPFAAHCCHHA